MVAEERIPCVGSREDIDGCDAELFAKSDAQALWLVDVRLGFQLQSSNGRYGGQALGAGQLAVSTLLSSLTAEAAAVASGCFP